ncbi:MAG: efflux RND transporter permease subunit [Planctomycetes bacterium]|nr:efflux RND transporter permease subunit [Planctomycetota bacterium]
MSADRTHGFTNAIVRVFLWSNLSIVLVILSAVLGLAALLITAREEDPQIVVPMADVYVQFPGHSAEEVERLVATPLERILYQIDGVEYVYSMSRPDLAIITVRFYVGEDRERSLVKLYKRIDEHIDSAPPGVAGWVVKPVEIDDVPIVTMTLTGAHGDGYALRRVGEELVERLAAVKNTSRAYVVGGQPRRVHVYLDPERLQAYGVAPLEVERAIRGANVSVTAGDFTRRDRSYVVESGKAFAGPGELHDLVVRVVKDGPVFLKDVAQVIDGPAEVDSYVRHGWGPARGFAAHEGFPGQCVGSPARGPRDDGAAQPAVTIAVAKKKGSNAVWVAHDVIASAERLRAEMIPDDMELIITRNFGLTADEKVNELVEALAVAIFIVIALLTLGLGWREALIVAVAVPVVFGLTLTINLLCGYTINRVTLFALILSLGLLVDDPIVDVENIARHFKLRGRATREIVLEAVAEIRPPLITATLAVIVSFLPLFFITGMMGPYMAPMALNVPVTMVMSMVVAFTITPWLCFHVLKRRYRSDVPVSDAATAAGEADDLQVVRGSVLYRIFSPLMGSLLRSNRLAWGLLGAMVVLVFAAVGVAAMRAVPLKMLPFDNKNELQFVLNFTEGITLERADAAVREIEKYLARTPEVVDFTSYVGTASPMDFNGMVRHYYLREGPAVAEIRADFVGKKSRSAQSHALGLRVRDELTAIAQHYGAVLSVVESPPGPPVIATLVAEVRGRPDHEYGELIAAARVVQQRLEEEPGVVDVDTSIEAESTKLVFVTDKEKAALNGVTVADVTQTTRIALHGASAGTVQVPLERHPLLVGLRLPRARRSSVDDLGRVYVKGQGGDLVPLNEIGHWEQTHVDKTIYHKNLERLVYVFAEVAGRTPAEVVLDVQADRAQADAESQAHGTAIGSGWIQGTPRPVDKRTYLANGGGVSWWLPDGFDVTFAGEGEWQITLDVFRDLGLAFMAALIGIYILLVAQTRAFGLPIVIMLAIPLTVIGIMPGFWLLNVLTGGQVGPYADPTFFTATAMIGMIALSGIVTRQAVIIVDFIHLSLRQGRPLFDAIIESCVVRLRPILLTVGTAMLSAAPIVIDPIFSGLAWALIFGLGASTAFTLFVIPVTYWLLYRNRPGHGLSAVETEVGAHEATIG